MSYVRILRTVCPRCESESESKIKHLPSEQPPIKRPPFEQRLSERAPWPTPTPQLPHLDIFPDSLYTDQSLTHSAFPDALVMCTPEPSDCPVPVSVLPMEMTDVGSGGDVKPIMVRKIYLAYFLPGRECHLDVLLDRAVKFYCMESADFAPYPELKDLGDFIIINRLRVLLFLVDVFETICRSPVQKPQSEGSGTQVVDWLTTCGLWPPQKMATQSIANLRHILYGSLQRAPFFNREAMAKLKTVLTIVDHIYWDRFCSSCVAHNVSMFGNAKLLDAPCLGGHGSHWFFEDKQSPASRDDRHLNQLLLENTPQPNVDMSGVLYLEAILPAKQQDTSGGGVIFVDVIDTYPYHEDLLKRLQSAMTELGFGSFCRDPWDAKIHQYYMTKLGNQVLVFSQKYAVSKRALLIRLFRECRRINIPCPLGKTERVVVDFGQAPLGCRRDIPDPMAAIDMGRRLHDLNG